MTTRNYTKDFYTNTEIALHGEEIVRELLHQLIPDEKFYSEHYNEGAYHLGDIISSKGIYYEVKDDGKIHETGNVFCEERKFWSKKKVTDGWMRTEKPDYLCVLDDVGYNLYVLDFEKLKKIYKNGNFYALTNMGDNLTGGYCVPLWKCRKHGVIVFETAYHYDAEWDCYELGKETLEAV